MKPPKNVLIDRDGTIIVEKHYLHDPAQVELVPGAGEALARLTAAGARLFVVTNQSGIGRGYYGLEDFQAVQDRLAELLAPYGVAFEAVAHCPHAPQESCGCRKPAQGMWCDLKDRFGLNAAETAMIGDNASDVAFGLACGLAESVLVLTGHGRRFAQQLVLPELSSGWLRLDPGREGSPTALAVDLPAAVDCLLRPGKAAP